MFENKPKDIITEWVKKITEQRLAFQLIPKVNIQHDKNSNLDYIRCVACGERLVADTKFCFNCGTIVSSVPHEKYKDDYMNILESIREK